MDAWLEIVIRQFILYSLPVLISLTTVSLVESGLIRQPAPHPFYAVSWAGTWLPWMAAIFFTRGIIFALPHPLQRGHRTAIYRCLTHLALCGLGLLLYSWSLRHHSPTGLPPLHHWWAKVFMFYNLCMACLHLLPLPGQWVGESLLYSKFGQALQRGVIRRYQVGIYIILAASPLPDRTIGSGMVFPVYEKLAGLAAAW